MKKLLFAASLLAVLPLSAFATETNTNTVQTILRDDAYRCLGKDSMADYLKRAWDEVPVIRAKLDNGHKTHLYVSHRGSWTLVEYRVDGKACVKASGDQLTSFQDRLPEKKPQS